MARLLGVAWQEQPGKPGLPKDGVKPTFSPWIIAPVSGIPYLQTAYWSFLPDFAKTVAPIAGLSTHSVSAQMVSESKFYGKAWALGQRCVIPIDSFKIDALKEGMNFSARAKDGSTLLLAAVFSQIQGGHLTFSIITTEPSEVLKPIAAKMPAIIEDWKRWISADLSPDEAFKGLRSWRGELEIGSDS